MTTTTRAALDLGIAACDRLRGTTRAARRAASIVRRGAARANAIADPHGRLAAACDLLDTLTREVRDGRFTWADVERAVAEVK